MTRCRTLLVVLAGLGAGLLVVFGGDRSSAAQDRGTTGGALFQRNCAACHGSDATGMPGTGVTAGPPIDDVDVAFVDLVLRTGRMPISQRSVGIPEKRLTDVERQAVVDWMRQTFDLPGEIPQIGRGDAGRGQQLFAANCSACHGDSATGGITGDGAVAPSLYGLDAVALAEAARVGPFEMPQVSSSVLDDEAIADIAAYVDHAEATSTTPIGLAEPGQAVIGVFAFLLFVGGLLALWMTVRAIEGRAGAGESDE